VRDVLSKSLGSKNPANVVKATMEALRKLRLREEVFRSRGREIKPAAPAQTPAQTAAAAS
jgi:small subunit ribosomal protein S5